MKLTQVGAKLLLMSLAMAALAYAAHEAVLRWRPKPPDPRELGLAWLRQEYRLGDEAFARIADLHRDYFVRCDAMCASLEQAHRPLLLRGRNSLPESSRQQALQREKALCESCLDSMVAHLRAVAALMPLAEGERFLREILPEVMHPPELQRLRSPSPPLQ